MFFLRSRNPRQNKGYWWYLVDLYPSRLIYHSWKPESTTLPLVSTLLVRRREQVGEVEEKEGEKGEVEEKEVGVGKVD